MKRVMLALAACLAFGHAAKAENAPVVVELFTSQGCSSCPPADEIMSMLAEREDVIPLSLHVDYWDYIGWKDEFADPHNAERQRAYATSAGRRSVFTPEMIVNGVSDIVGTKPMALAMAIEKHKAEAKHVDVRLIRSGAERITIFAKALASGVGPMDVVMLRYQPARVARITRGENAGRTLEYVNVAQDWQHVMRWDGREPLEVEVDAPGAHPVVVLIQAEELGPIKAAARLR